MTDSGAEQLESRLGVEFRDRDLLETALTHRSFANEQGLETNYERLEFLGDAVLGLVSAEWLFLRYPDDPEGKLSELNAYLVSRPVLADLAETLGIGELLRLGVGEERSGGRGKRSLLADAFEAVMGAVYLDRGLSAVRDTLVPLFESALQGRDDLTGSEAKTRLQELTQARGWRLPEYRHVASQGPDHQKQFTVECWVDGRLAGHGSGRSKKTAEQRAAHRALFSLRESEASSAESKGVD